MSTLLPSLSQKKNTGHVVLQDCAHRVLAKSPGTPLSRVTDRASAAGCMIETKYLNKGELICKSRADTDIQNSSLAH